MQTAIKTAPPKRWYLGVRDNPQMEKPYYKVYGQISEYARKKAEKTSYGSMTLEGYNTLEEIKSEIEKLKAEGYSVSNSYNCKGM